MNVVGFPILGKCEACGLNKTPVRKYRGKWYCLFDIDRIRDGSPARVRWINKEVDKFNRTLRKSLGNDNASTEIDYS